MEDNTSYIAIPQMLKPSQRIKQLLSPLLFFHKYKGIDFGLPRFLKTGMCYGINAVCQKVQYILKTTCSSLLLTSYQINIYSKVMSIVGI